MWKNYPFENKNIRKGRVVGFVLMATLFGGVAACSASEQNVGMKTSTEMASEFQSDWLNVKISGVETQEAPNLILLPGLASSSQSWNAVIDTLGESHRLHIIDISGFAGTPAKQVDTRDVVDGIVRDVEGYITQNHLEHVTVMGHSMGGFSALKVAHSFGETLDQIIIVDSLPFYAALFNPAATADMMLPQADQMRAQTIGMEAEAFKASQSQFIRRMSKDTQAQSDILDWSLTSNRTVMANALHNLLTQDMRPKLTEISTPVHVVYAWDAMMGVSVDQMDATYKTQYTGLENVTLTRVDNSFHFIMRDQPNAFLAAVQPTLNAK